MDLSNNFVGQRMYARYPARTERTLADLIATHTFLQVPLSGAGLPATCLTSPGASCVPSLAFLYR
jgi:hypothetical protein